MIHIFFESLTKDLKEYDLDGTNRLNLNIEYSFLEETERTVCEAVHLEKLATRTEN